MNTNKQEKFGLIWENKIDEQAKLLETKTPILKLKTEHSFSGRTIHSMINADNSHALKALEKDYREKVNVIYIDPPYNTGSKDFIYNDNYIDKDDAYRHSSWLSFMEYRLQIAKNLLSENGVIFVSIDDSEHARLKLLLDQIFGSKNMISNMIWQSKSGGGHDSNLIVNTCEYILVYAKDKNKVKFNTIVTEESVNSYKLRDEHYESRGGYKLEKLDRGSLNYSASLDYPITAPDSTLIYPQNSTLEESEIRKQNKTSRKDWQWRWGQKQFTWGIENDFIVFKKNKENNWTVFTKQYEKVDKTNQPIERSTPYRNLILSQEANTSNGTREMKSILGNRDFSYPKPLNLIKNLLKMSTQNDSIVLDFFAGSGTTLHATAEMNYEDDGTRECIIVTDGGKTEELGNSSKNATENSFNIALDIALPRVTKALTGESWADQKNHPNLKDGLNYYVVELGDKND